MAAPRSLLVETGVVRLLDEEKNEESPTEKKYKTEKSPLSRWEFAAAFGVFLVFSSGLLCIYLTTPPAEYEMLKLPRTLADLPFLNVKNLTLGDRPIVNWLWPEKLRYFQAEAGLALGDLRSVKDLYDFKTLAILFHIGSILIIPILLKGNRVHG